MFKVILHNRLTGLWVAQLFLNLVNIAAKNAQAIVKLQSLAFPIVAIRLWEPEVMVQKAPRMEVESAKSDARLDQLSRFVSGQGAVTVEWLDRKAGHFSVQALATLPRGRYNYTVLSSQPGRYFWFSHLWIVP